MIIATGQQHWNNIESQLDLLGIEHITYDRFVFEDQKDNISKVIALMNDELSIETLRKVITARTQNDYTHIADIYISNQYFAVPAFAHNYGKAETFIDAGSYVGDTIERFLFSYEGIFSRIYAFEPSAKQYKALQCRISRLCSEWALDTDRIITENAALSDKTGLCSVFPGGNNMGSDYIADVNNDTGYYVKQYSLDDYIGDDRIDFLKADIEGTEMRMLVGASNSIRKYKPKIAICLYHNPFDFIDIPLFIYGLRHDYRFAVRHHSYEYNETVLYAW